MVYGLVLGLLIMVGISLWFRVRLQRESISGVETTASPLSTAVQDLVATAGGVYLAIVALTSFLKLETPDKITLLQASVDPLALTAIGMAILQPIVLRIYHKFKSSR